MGGMGGEENGGWKLKFFLVFVVGVVLIKHYY